MNFSFYFESEDSELTGKIFEVVLGILPVLGIHCIGALFL